MENQVPPNLVSSPLPFILTLSPATLSLTPLHVGFLVLSYLVVKLLSQSHCTCCSLCLAWWAPRLPVKLTPLPTLGLYSNIQYLLNESFLHSPSIPQSHPTQSLFPLLRFIFLCVCTYKIVHDGNFQTYTKMEKI